MKLQANAWFERAEVAAVGPEMAVELESFYAACMAMIRKRGGVLRWRNMGADQMRQWAEDGELHQVTIPQSIIDPVECVYDIEPGPLTHRVAAFLASEKPNRQIWRPEEDTPHTVYVSRLGLNARLMGNWMLGALGPKIVEHLASQGYSSLRFHHVPALNDVYENPSFGLINRGGVQFTEGDDQSVYMVRRELPLV